MKYVFHVGDYVETKDGRVGYITNVLNTHLKEYPYAQDNVYHDLIMKLNTCDRYDTFEFHGYTDNLSEFFNRIALYDFTEEKNKPKDKIEPLKISYINDCFQDMGKKINELVSVINELRENK